MKLDTELVSLSILTPEQWRQLRKLQGRFATSYLKRRYGSPDTYILLAYAEETLVHVEWIVPAKKIRRRYPFVTKDSYSIISCLTSEDFRGRGIYPSQIQRVVGSNIPAKTFWIWTTAENIQSLRGIHKAGATKVGEYIQKRWFWGCISRIELVSEGSVGNDDKINYVSVG